MEKYRITEIKDKGNYKVTYIWHLGTIQKNVPVNRCMAFSTKIILLVREKDDMRFTLPGGGVEKGETALEALHREFLEEVQFTRKC